MISNCLMSIYLTAAIAREGGRSSTRQTMGTGCPAFAGHDRQQDSNWPERALVFDRKSGRNPLQGLNELGPLFAPDEAIEIALVRLGARLQLPHRLPAERRDLQG